jgi:pyruvate,orthophosphate dikinase
MKKEFSSDAFEANLFATRIAEIEIPENHQKFLDLSVDYWGIHNIAEEFVKELNHPYFNQDFLSEQLNKIALDNLWLYLKAQDPKFAVETIIDFYREIFAKSTQQTPKEKLFNSFMQFYDQLSEQYEDFHQVSKEMLDLLESWILDQKNFEIVVENSGAVKTYLWNAPKEKDSEAQVFRITKSALYKNIIYWRESANFEHWYDRNKRLFTKDYAEEIHKISKQVYQDLIEKIDAVTNRKELIELAPSYKEIANFFRQFASVFETSVEKIYYIFYLLYLKGMNYLKDHLLWDINKLLKDITKELSSEQILQFFDETFAIYESLKEVRQSAILDCLSALGKAISESGDQELLAALEMRTIKLGFVTPGEIYLTEDWQIHKNINHVKNIRTWLELIESAPVEYGKLLPALIVNLRIGGIFISDTDLFQKDVSNLLNSKIEPIYKQVKQLCRAFPVYFNEIGAEGELREVTTLMDELSRRKDKLIHFLRKQIHTESNNTHIELTKKILRFWSDGDLSKLDKIAPDDVIKSIDLNHPWFADVNSVMQHLCNDLGVEPENLIDIKESLLVETLEKIPIDDELDKKRIRLMVRLQILLNEKYSFSTKNIIQILKRFNFFSDAECQTLSDQLNSGDFDAALKTSFEFMDRLNQVVFSGEKTESWENIYYKRHVAVGIPSMYGEYRERKFEALGLIFRLEKLTAKLIDKQIGKINFDYLTGNSLHNIFRILEHFNRGMELDGIKNPVFASNLMMFRYSLTSKSFSLSQYINIFQFIHQNIKEIINKYFFRVYDSLLKTILPQIFPEMKKMDEKSRSQFLHKKSEEFYRDILSSAYLLQTLDNFISITISTLREMNDNYAEDLINDIMSYDPELSISPLYEATEALDNQVFLGSKAYFLKKLFAYGFPVPPGFVITTEVFRLRKAIISVPQIRIEMDNMIRANIKKLEDMTGLEYGNPQKPLLLSVRSGTAISMPGAMSTFLNVGLNDEIVEALSKQPNYGWTSWDSYRRFLQSWGMAYGINRDEFDKIMIDYKSKYKISLKQQFSGERMREIAFSYKALLKKYDIHFMDDPFLQLKQAIICVLDSWSSDRAKVYREHLNVSKSWGTAVVIQKMVLGNIHLDSGTGVVFTHYPDDPKQGVNLYGDFTLCSQGEDIVGGLVNVTPISEQQRETSFKTNAMSLEKDFPEIYKGLNKYSKLMTEEYGFNHQEIEFTFESGKFEDLYILQTRDQIIRKKDNITVFSSKQENMYLAGVGIGTGGGAMNGLAAFDLDDILKYKSEYPDKNCILIRPDTVPDDIAMLFECDGMLTGKGGATSHSAVTAVRLGKTCIVNCLDLKMNEAEKICLIGATKFKSGDEIAIDGHTGNIYKGEYPIEVSDIEFQ